MAWILDAESFKEAKITLLLIFINLTSYIVFNLILDIEYLLLLAQINSKVIVDFELWRLITSMFLHADVIHLFSNMVALLIFGAAVENNFRRYQYLIIYFLSGLIGNISSLILLPLNVISLGASGAIFGLIGAAFIFFAREDHSFILLGLIYIVYFIIMSFTPGINPWAHLFGLLGGVVFGYFFKHKKKYEDHY
ncbi:MAG: rhomboid family intramembrane serine protease [Candidatus Thorarchaeota archaeon]